MEYYFSHLDPSTFQRLINAILIARFGENIRLTPVRGADGGRDGETAPANPYFKFELSTPPPKKGITGTPEKGRYLFQVKHHRTIDTRLIDARKAVVSDFETELRKNVLARSGDERVNYFFLLTNVPSSRDAIASVDRVRHDLVRRESNLHVDVWWSERLTAFLDQMPTLWPAFPDLFAGKKVPLLPEIISGGSHGLPRIVRIAIERQYRRDSVVKFRQIELENSLSRLFIDLDISLEHLPDDETRALIVGHRYGRVYAASNNQEIIYYNDVLRGRANLMSALGVLLNETSTAARRIILEGGPGQGKSTVTQMLAQIYRDIVLGQNKLEPEGRWETPQKVRLPFRVELRNFAEWLGKNQDGSVEEYLAYVMKQETGGSSPSVDQIHSLVENSPVLLVFDGLDEVGSEDSRDEVLEKVVECVDRFESNLHTDLRVILTTRPPAIAGRREQLPDFRRFTITPLESSRVADFVKRWVAFQLQDTAEREWVRQSFEKRQNEIHVKALATNPMQLSVLLHFIRLKGEAFPDRRVELYKEYFKTVIDRDVEKSVELRQNRDTVEVLHQLLGYKIHSLTEAKKADGTLGRRQLLDIVEDWITGQGTDPKRAHELFKIGEERLGLIVALKGEGEEAVYGFEIQPIREYFAAAFISDQIQGNAHSVFQDLVRRTYWKEVALFLAGLRRANEKADLVSRCKIVDQDHAAGWRQDGRAMILQLLQEGVFSQPPHVYNEALEFLIDLLDSNSLPVQNQPKGLLNILPALIGQGETNKHANRVCDLISKVSDSTDEYSVYRLYSVAQALLEPHQFIREILKYKGKSPTIAANVRLRWPGIWGKSISEASKSPTYWDGVSDEIWADALWDVFIDGNQCKATTPARFHSLLVEEFAMNPLPITTGKKLTKMMAVDHFAVSKLLTAQKTLFDVFLSDASHQHSELTTIDEGDFSGLDDSICQALTELTQISHKLVGSLIGGRGIIDAMGAYLKGLQQYLRKPGISAWLACRCFTNLLQITVAAEFNQRRRSRATESKPDPVYILRDQPDWSSLMAMAGELFGRTGIVDLSYPTGFRSSVFFDEYGIPVHSSLIPTHLRLESEKEPTLVTDLLASSICDGMPLPYTWIGRIPLTPSMIRPLVTKCWSCIPELLLFLNKCRVSRSGGGDPLLVQQIQRILKVIRNSDDPRLLAGALVALSESTFLQLAGTELTLRMLSAEIGRTQLGSRLFEPRRIDPHFARSKDIAIVNEIARGVLKGPLNFPFRTLTDAATYIAEHSTVSQSALMSEEATLGIFFSEAN